MFRSSANETAKPSNDWFIWIEPSVVPCRLLHPSEFASKSWDNWYCVFQLGSKSITDGIGLSRPTELAFDGALGRKSGDNVKPELQIEQEELRARLDKENFLPS